MIVGGRRAAVVSVAFALALAACSSGGGDGDRFVLTTVSADISSNDASVSSTTSSSGVEDSGTEASEVEATPDPLVGELTITVVAVHPHDSDAFTQGLEVHDGRLLEGTGLYGESDRRLVEITSGAVQGLEALNSGLFGEGLTVVGDEVLQLTLKAGVYIRADAETLTETGRGLYDGEGWGLCFDGSRLVMSDGTPTLTFRDPETFEGTGTIEVTLNGEPLANLNELECVNGQVLANVWLTEFVVVIDPASGEVVATLDASSLRPDDAPFDNSRFALNGIAHDPTTGRFYLTGKRWPVVYEVELS